MNIILFGAPGVGKGTQAELLASKLNLPHVSTGAIFRSAISEGTDLGLKAKAFSDSGTLVPDELTTSLAIEAISTDKCPNGFILDGFPRNINQAQALQESLNIQNRNIDFVVCLTVPENELVSRMLNRGRVDDTEEVIRTRFKVYEELTSPVLDFYKNIMEIIQINGVGELNEISERIVNSLVK